MERKPCQPAAAKYHKLFITIAAKTFLSEPLRYPFGTPPEHPSLRVAKTGPAIGAAAAVSALQLLLVPRVGHNCLIKSRLLFD